MTQRRDTSSRRPGRRESRYGIKALIAAGAVAATAAGWAALVAEASGQDAGAAALPAGAITSTSTTAAATMSLWRLPRVSAPIAQAITQSSR